MDTRLPVVVVEEEPFLRATLAEILEDEGWAEPFVTGSEEEGLALLRDLGAPCLLIADLLLTTPEAVRFLDVISASPDRDGVGVILLSGLSPQGLTGVLHHLVDGILYKPFELDELLSTLAGCRDRLAPRVKA